MAVKNGINGIPVKIKVSKSDFEMIYLASFRKCPKLKKMSREFVKLTVVLEKYNKLERSYAIKMDSVDPMSDNFEADIEKYSNSSMDMIEKINDGADEIKNLTSEYVITALVGAGYTRTQAKEYEELIPESRFPEILAATRTGAAKVLDFFTEEPQHEQS